MKYKYEITFGMEYNKDRFGVVNAEHKLDQILKRVASDFGGYTLVKADGGYIMANGEFVREESRALTIITHIPRPIQILNLAEEIKLALDQESVIITKTELEVDFI